MRFIENIDILVTLLRSNHRKLTRGGNCFILILYLLCRRHVMYKVEDRVRDTTYLRALFTDIEPGHFVGVPIMAQTLDGNTADVIRYLIKPCNSVTNTLC